MSEPIQNRPDVARFVTEWRSQNEGRTFNFADPREQESFLTALLELGRHIAHTARQARPFTITSKDGLSTIYLNVDN